MKGKSKCCDAGTYQAPEYYATNMQNINKIDVCLCCGKKTTKR